MIMTIHTPIATITAMQIDQLTTLNQWFSPGYPLGSFAYSHGLETAIQDGRVKTAEQLEDWLRDLLTYGTGRSDVTLLYAAHECRDDAAALAVDTTARAFAPSAERLHEGVQQGDAFCRTTSAIWAIDLPPLTHPVAVGYAAGQLGIAADLTGTLYLQAFAANLVSCAVRLVPLGQTEGQWVLQRLAGLCAQIAQTAAQDGIEDLASTTFAADIAAMRHETLEHRIFRT
ncbi:MAG: urease accessory UreF family protein [Sulfitobacter sp.]